MLTVTVWTVQRLGVNSLPMTLSRNAQTAGRRFAALPVPSVEGGELRTFDGHIEGLEIKMAVEIVMATGKWTPSGRTRDPAYLVRMRLGQFELQRHFIHYESLGSGTPGVIGAEVCRQQGSPPQRHSACEPITATILGPDSPSRY